MAQTIYKLWMFKYTPAWYHLTPDEQNQLSAKIGESLKQVGGELVMVRYSVWASEEWLAWGVEKYPSVEAAQQHALNLYEMKWFMYVESKSYLGVEMPQA